MTGCFLLHRPIARRPTLAGRSAARGISTGVTSRGTPGRTRPAGQPVFSQVARRVVNPPASPASRRPPGGFRRDPRRTHGSSGDRRAAIPWVVRRIAAGSPQDASVIHALILRRSADGAALSALPAPSMPLSPLRSGEREGRREEKQKRAYARFCFSSRHCRSVCVDDGGRCDRRRRVRRRRRRRRRRRWRSGIRRRRHGWRSGARR